MLYTSGTTGHPKGVLHRHREMAEHSMICTYFLKYNRDSIGLVVAPLYHWGVECWNYTAHSSWWKECYFTSF